MIAFFAEVLQFWPLRLAVGMVYIAIVQLGLLIGVGHANSGKHDLCGPQCVNLIGFTKVWFG